MIKGAETNWNRVIKDEYTLRERLPLSRFLTVASEFVNGWSLAVDEVFATLPTMTLKDWTEAYQWAKLPKEVILTYSDDAFKHYEVPAAKIVVLIACLGATASGNPLADVDPNNLQCDPAGQTFLLLPSYSDCNKYYVCDHGREVQMSCPGGLIFDFVLQTCNWDWAVECVLRTVPEEDIEEGSGGEDSEEGSGEEFTGFQDAIASAESHAQTPLIREEDEFAAVLDCHTAVGAAKQAAYKGDCQRFWRCIDGLPQSSYCSDGLFFNEQSQQCDFEANVKCGVNHEAELQGEYIVYQ